jgi:hypothetical protein
MYYENDKIMLLQTGEVLTVIMEVRAAGHTRQRADAAVGIVPPDPLPPPPAESILA